MAEIAPRRPPTFKIYRPAHSDFTAYSIWEAIGISPRGLQLHAAVLAGFPICRLEQLAVELNIATKELADHLRISRSTLRRRIKTGRLSTKESDLIYQTTHALSTCTQLFEGDQAAAWAWILAPQLALGGVRPIDMLRTHVGAAAVHDLIGRLEHGVCV